LLEGGVVEKRLRTTDQHIPGWEEHKRENALEVDAWVKSIQFSLMH